MPGGFTNHESKKILSGLLPEYLYGFLLCRPLLEARKLDVGFNIHPNPNTIMNNNLHSKASVACEAELGKNYHDTATPFDLDMNDMHPSIATEKSFPYDRSPTEIRDLIFDDLDDEDGTNKPYFAWNTQGCIPAFLVALRAFDCLRITYEHAVDRFRKFSSSVIMDEITSHHLGSMYRAEVEVFQKLNIELLASLLDSLAILNNGNLPLARNTGFPHTVPLLARGLLGTIETHSRSSLSAPSKCARQVQRQFKNHYATNEEESWSSRENYPGNDRESRRSRNSRLMDWSQGAGKAYPNAVGRWFNGYWDAAFFEDNSFRLRM
ncbi:hypothetical protein L207DRAFT_624557 [Hyaloscypha variabilis F]|uniref:Uncharacterized protein n=1 Tax=Hyaloscypha variabilis (strain UAMH 11265 / GT02V1 / F) TaxID=1149755 RepID=A0A2J6RNY4_HYAVF|nr:hypothetical protein L207DRAFT_624557 [Hyaloscypha variabilis F]